MTGELPVALVHAACVLQVLVSVVLVCKHLAAPVTLETLTAIWGRKYINKYVRYGRKK